MTDTVENWMSPLNKLIWIKAFRKKQTSVTLRDGRRFELDFERTPGKVLIYPAVTATGHDTIVPRGWFDLDRVTDDQWLTT